MEHLGKLAINNTSRIGMIPSASKYVWTKFADQCLHIINNRDRLNVLKGSTKMQNIESLFKYQSCFYSFQRNNGANHIGMKRIWNNKLFPSLNVINGKPSTNGIKGVIRHYNYR